MTTTNKLSELIDSGMIDEEAMTADGFDECVIGVTTDGKVVYDAGKIVENLSKQGMDFEDALDYFHYNIEGSYVGEFTTIYVWL